MFPIEPACTTSIAFLTLAAFPDPPQNGQVRIVDRVNQPFPLHFTTGTRATGRLLPPIVQTLIEATPVPWVLVAARWEECYRRCSRSW